MQKSKNYQLSHVVLIDTIINNALILSKMTLITLMGSSFLYNQTRNLMTQQILLHSQVLHYVHHLNSQAIQKNCEG